MKNDFSFTASLANLLLLQLVIVLIIFVLEPM